MEVISTNIINLNKFKNQTQLRISNLEELTKKQIKVDQFFVEKKKLSKELYSHVNEKLSVFSEKVVQFSQQLEEKQIIFETKVKENEKNTIWKIQDCEKLLQSRVSEKYVNDAINGLKNKIEMELKFKEEREMERLFKSF